MVALRAACGEPERGRHLIAVPSFTFTATACAIRWAGFVPLFVDVDPDTWQLDPTALAAALHRHHGHIAGILGCSTFGSAPPVADRVAWRELAATHEIPLVIDSAAGFGAVDEDGDRLGSQGDVEVFSFHATKPFAIGEGGAIFIPDDTAAERVSRLINFGIDPDLRTSAMPGMNAKMSEIAAATGLAMLDRYDATLTSRRATAESLQTMLDSYPVTYQRGSGGSTWQVFQLLVPDIRARTRALEEADRLRIEVRTCFDPPLHRHPAFVEMPRASAMTVTNALAERCLSLPMANTLGPRQIDRISELLRRTFGRTPC